MKTARTFLLYFFSLLSTLFAYASEGYLNEANEHQYKVSANFDDRAEISIEFISGTGYVSWIQARNSETGNLDDYGRYYVGTFWKAYLPVDSNILVAVRGNGVNCYYFRVKEPTFGHIEMGGGSATPSIEIVAGEALEIKRLYNTYSAAGCPDP
ncbi:MAG: hypothetical protein B0D91_12235 [Oceanospirillales bacterium LUC14_002_19_P2]|nr:MAG: hypothetical protein B0D91_12235 [Oceanospirillales bacterium LUC14_002_19_P2]